MKIRKTTLTACVVLALAMTAMAGTRGRSAIMASAKQDSAVVDSAVKQEAPIPENSVIDEVMANLEQAREDQISVNSEWDKLETIHRTDGHRNSTLTDTT